MKHIVISTLITLSITALLVLKFATSTPTMAAVYWADRVIDNSGHKKDRSLNVNCYSPNQLLGKPSIMPNFGESVCAWSPQAMRRNDYVVLGYNTPINVEQVAIYENINPGAIIKVTLIGRDNDTIIYMNSDPRPTNNSQGKMFNIYCDRTSFKVSQVRIDINTYRYNNDGYQIDAVAISDSKEPIDVNINFSKDIAEMGDPENLGENINSRAAELAPVIAPDGKTIYFTRERHPENSGQQSIWYSEIDKNGKFQLAKNIGPPLNTKFNSFAISILPDGNSMLVGNIYYPDGRAGAGFSMTYKKGNEWSMPEPVKIRDFYNTGGKGSYCLASSGKILILSIQGTDGLGSSDLYVSFLNDDGTWSRPMNLGTEINTPDREDSPFLAADGVTLYFSSAGYPGYGSNDIFMTKRLDDSWKRWTEPVNLGPKINTNGWDAYFTITASGDYAYFVSSQNSMGNEDIFRVALPHELRPEKVILVAGKVIDKKTNKPVAANIYYEKLSTGENMGIARSNPTTGEYKIALPANEKYGFRAEAKDYIAINENLDLTKLKDNISEIKRDLYLVPLEQGQAIVINNLFFEFAQSELLPESFPELDRLAKLMQESPTMKIRLEGHTDNIGTNQANMTLSQKRVEAVMNYLVSKGVDKNKITTVGRGALKPVVSNNTEEGRAKNRRVECYIISK
ncbi:MAG: OmpA family protein [Bacteroidetes bacterium]|nr:OmpA family protein [Bacteroidota bacterium]